MSFYIDVQHACDTQPPVSDEQLEKWATLALSEHQEKGELTLRIVESAEITELNHSYRKQNKATNVLAFPSALPDNIELDFPLIGDVIICPEVLHQESIEQQKTLEAHWAHIVIHGVLHLLGYDHIKDNDTLVMQAMEQKLLAKLGYPNPYLTEET